MARHALKEAPITETSMIPGRHSVDSATVTNIASLAARRARLQEPTDQLTGPVAPASSWNPEDHSDLKQPEFHDISAEPTTYELARRPAWDKQYKAHKYDAATYIPPSRRVTDDKGHQLLTHDSAKSMLTEAERQQADADFAASQAAWHDNVEQHRQQVIAAHELADAMSVTEQLPKAS